nr:PREDICTED: uncharacterized protein LOC109041008 [Bemisia tabaci]
MRDGWNNNPTARQLETSYNRCLVNLNLKSPVTGNCIQDEEMPILDCSSREKKKKEVLESEPNYEDKLQFNFEEGSIFLDHIYELRPEELTPLTKIICVHISGFVVKRLIETLKCPACTVALKEDPVEKDRLLVDKKNEGGLIIPGKIVVDTYCFSLRESCTTTFGNNWKKIHEAEMHYGSSM